MWVSAMDKELENMNKNNVWDQARSPNGEKNVRSMCDPNMINVVVNLYIGEMEKH